MNLKLVFTQSFIISLVCATGFAVIAILVGEQNIAWFDNRLISLIQGQENVVLTPIMKFFTFIGSGLPITIITIIIMVVLYSVLKFRWELLFFVGVIAGSALLNVVLKLIFHRARPTIHRIVEANGYSFPSGHSMAAFTLYGVLCFLLWKHARGAFTRFLLIIIGSIMILAIGVSRIYLGVHYPSDVVGGYLASGTWLAVSIWIYQRMLDKRSAKVRG
ncbi:phosphatase PAP2 family protein [Paenibacillus macquariensis]|uniref:Undecaprenyl-diphosphatase n=1 Tax=Paenibacillus macquariensis TaxID=948756 RepID=A0ABY1JPN8_9BACL|nr:phosphatase PAP2 family protein [Paenibacillus macquariensis]MEC0094030.1 phosphatase PAP2 family protein [Paenibacillus macquariensis]OAB37496.1 phosphoesterase PA-phosphatase [Paenibacillus macquariensis subsp. macquariensis]SIQ54734.1 undecaprenyl-diphosphatase [Paenibacillus macquariensis]